MQKLEISYSYAVLCLLLLFLPACDGKVPCDGDVNMETAINVSSCLNADGDFLAILVGLRVQGQNRPAVLETRPVILQLNDDFTLKQFYPLHDEVLREMDWRPGYGNHFYYVTYEKIYGSGDFYEPSSGKWFQRGAGTLKKLDADRGFTSLTIINPDDRPVNMTYLRWSPDGSRLTGLIPEPSSQKLNSGKLAVSSDGGRTITAAEIEIYGPPIWENNNELLVMTDFDHIISKVLFDNSDFKITDTLAVKDSQIWIVGIFNDKPVYVAYPRKDNEGRYRDKSRRLFAGDTLIYETDDALLRVLPFPSFLFIETDGKVLIYDKDLSLCHEKQLDPMTRTFNFHPDTGLVFLIKDWKTILSYDFTKNEKAQVLFSVDMLDK